MHHTNPITNDSRTPLEALDDRSIINNYKITITYNDIIETGFSKDEKVISCLSNPFVLCTQTLNLSFHRLKDEEARKSKAPRGFAAKNRNNSILQNAAPR